MTRDVFVAAPSVLTSESKNLSLLSMNRKVFFCVCVCVILIGIIYVFFHLLLYFRVIRVLVEDEEVQEQR